ncbi:hypothetical protein [Nonomuraea sp. NPDC050310]|uniref:hypothetical protein n=1 Tax=Nonomuraea sp. NPDC050310 TaxID=3154935 RepID=UPI0033F8CB3D
MRWPWWAAALVSSCLPYLLPGQEESFGWFAYGECRGFGAYLRSTEVLRPLTALPAPLVVLAALAAWWLLRRRGRVRAARGAAWAGAALIGAYPLTVLALAAYDAVNGCGGVWSRLVWGLVFQVAVAALVVVAGSGGARRALR